MPKSIEEGALFVADAHYPHHGDEFIKLLKKLQSKEIKTAQLFLMGDIFDLLFGHNEYIKTFSQEAITLLQELSKTLEIHYLEGNHDFCLKEIFPHISVYSRAEQPIEFTLNNQLIYLAHGDLYETGFGYDLYCKTLRTKTALTMLKPFERQIIDHRMEKLQQKTICRPFSGFENRAKKIASHYPKDALVVEGHFHQGRVCENYISLPSLACQKEIGVISNGKLIHQEIKA